MQPACEVVDVPSVLLAVASEELPRSRIPQRIVPLFDLVYAWVRTASVRQVGHNYALYDRCTPQSLRMRVGFPVSGRFVDTERVACVELAPGRAAQAVHVGPYSALDRTYEALHAWCKEHGLSLTGESWEVYGDPTDDPARLETALHLRIAT